MQESARGGHFFWDFAGRKWGFSDFQLPDPENCSLDAGCTEIESLPIPSIWYLYSAGEIVDLKQKN